VLALGIFLGTYTVLALGRVPRLRIDRTGAAIIGAALMIASGTLTFTEAMQAVDHETLVLLFGMMIVVANLRLAGFFKWVAAWVVRHAHRPLTLLGGIVAVAGVFSAVFVNDTMCLVLTPLVLEIVLTLDRNPIPYLLAVAMASNAGSVATITGNPQNMMIGSLSGIPYGKFAASLTPVAVLALLVVFGVIAAMFRREFFHAPPVDVPPPRVRVNRILLIKSLTVSAGMIVLFFAGKPVSAVALIGGALLLITRRVKPEKVYHEIDWSLLVLFAGLFIVVAGFEKTSLPERFFDEAGRFGLARTGVLASAAAILSNIVSNVPAVLVFRPLVSRMADPAHGWLTLAMASTLAGNLTILGSVANLIVIQRAKDEVRISFWQYARAGIPVTVLSLILGVAWLGLM
jgi:Na+/H+ antiporter NhaD/arsenite permease-like protein